MTMNTEKAVAAMQVRIEENATQIEYYSMRAISPLGRAEAERVVKLFTNENEALAFAIEALRHADTFANSGYGPAAKDRLVKHMRGGK
jgi:hypothetical protein